MNHFEKYFNSLRSFKISEITEHSHRKELQELLELYIGPKMKVLHEPKRDGKHATHAATGRFQPRRGRANLHWR